MGADAYSETDTETRPAVTLPAPATAGVVVAVVIGTVVAVGLGVFAKVHDPRFFALNVAGFSTPGAVKSWLATVAVGLAIYQMLTALAMYRLLPRSSTSAWLGRAHVWSGRIAVLASLPVAVHCLYALGFGAGDNRVLFHSLFGCLFYGAFVTKMLLLTRPGLRAWVLPIAGGVLFFILVYTWLTSALWFFQRNGLTF